jgi:hypothetical protein
MLLLLLLVLCSFVNSVTEQLTGTVSLGAAVFASVLFASGMPTEFDVVSGTRPGLDVSSWQLLAAEQLQLLA